MDPIYACCSALEDRGGPYSTKEECADALFFAVGPRHDLDQWTVGFAIVIALVFIALVFRRVVVE
jgi:hypothetical protein